MMMLSLMRSAHINDYPIFGGYENSLSSDLGLELRQERTFRYALVPHEGSWRQAHIFRAGLAFNNPLLVLPLEQHPGRLPEKWGLLEVSSSNVILSALMPAEDGHGIIARVYEAAGEPASNVSIRFTSGIQSALEVNLMEDPLHSLPVAKNAIHFNLHPFEIKTFRVQLNSVPDR
jgi:alpha-mannosidase